MAGVAMLTAVSVILQYLDFPVPMLIPPFIKFDFSDLPALIGAYAYGPLAGVIIELIKNLIHCAITKSATVGELSNFLLGAAFAGTAGFIYKMNKTKKTAIVGGIIGAVIMGIVSILSNYWIVYPFYYKAYMPEEVVLSAYQAIMPAVKNVLQCLIIFNMPFTMVKGIACVLVSIPIYKPLTRVLKDPGRANAE